MAPLVPELFAASDVERRLAAGGVAADPAGLREEFDAVKDMARLAREENEALKARIAALEAKLGGSSS